MTHTTEQERAEFEAWARDRYPSIDLTRDRDDYSKALAKDYWSLWQAARRAPAAPVPQGWTDQLEQVLCDLQVGPYPSIALAVKRIEGLLAAAPQQPVAAPVQLPEPQAEIEVRSMKTYLDLSIHEWRDTLPDGAYNIYTEQQLRELLAAHGIQERST